MKTIEEAAIEHSESRAKSKIWQDEIAKDFNAGVEFAQRWIQVEEELPPVDIHITVKFINYRKDVDYWTGMLRTEERRSHFLDQHLKFTHWRPIKYQ